MKKFSVLSSVYYKEKPEFLNQYFQSMSNQTLLPTEIVLVKDGPLTKELDEVIDRWSQNISLKVFSLEKNVGLGEALNYGINKCQYEIILRADTDDINQFSRFGKQVDFLFRNPHISVVGSQIEEFDTEIGDLKRIRQLPIDHEELHNFSKSRSPINHPTVAYRKNAVLNSGSYMDFPQMEDYYLWLRMLQKGYKFSNIDEILVYARIGNGMTERRRGISYIKTEFELAKQKRDLVKISFISNWSIFVIRSLARLLPTKLLDYVYGILRKRA